MFRISSNLAYIRDKTQTGHGTAAHGFGLHIQSHALFCRDANAHHPRNITLH